MKLVPLRDIQITKIQPDGSFKPFPIYYSEYYRALVKSSEAIYEDYIIQLGRYHYKRPVTDKDEMSYADFETLHQKIVEKGFDPDCSPIRIFNNEAGDGQHRLSILYFLKPHSSLELDQTGKVIRWVS